MLDVRQLWRALHGVPQLLLVQPEQLNYDLAYALALLPLVIAGIIFFLQDALLLFAISFLAGIVCLLALQLARLTIGLPAWVGFRATHPLVASILIVAGGNASRCPNKLERRIGSLPLIVHVYRNLCGAYPVYISQTREFPPAVAARSRSSG